MRPVLMLSYRFAPQGGAGSLRTTKFVKYLPALGWQPIVHTVANPHWDVWDDALIREVSSDVPVYRSRTFEPEGAGERAGEQLIGAASRTVSGGVGARLRRVLGTIRRQLRVFVLIPDRQALWIPWAVIRTLAIVRKHRPVAIYSSSPPHSAQMVLLIVKRLTGLPWVVDFRDLWMQSIHRQELYKRRWRHAIEAAMERAVARHADRIVVTTEPNRDEIARKYDAASKVVVIPNGYDAADFDCPAIRPPDVDAGCFNMTMTGQVVKLVDMKPFFHALARATARDPELRQRLRVRLIGADPTPYAQLIRELDLTGTVQYLRYMPHERVLQYVRASDVLFLCHIPDWISAGAKMSVKLFEYFAARRPILAMTSPDSLTAGLLRDAGVGVRVAPDDVDAIVAAIDDLFNKWSRNERSVEPAEGFLERFERGRQAARLAGVIEEALSIARTGRSATVATTTAIRDQRAA